MQLAKLPPATLAQVSALLVTAQEQNAIHYKAQIMKVSEFKKLPNFTVGNMHDVTYPNPDKMSIRAHAHKVARLTCKFVLFYVAMDGKPRVITAGSLDGMLSEIGARIRNHAACMAIVNS